MENRLTAETRRAQRDKVFLSAGRRRPEVRFRPFGLSEDMTSNLNELTGKIIGAAIEVHNALGPGLLESAYEECLCYEFGTRGINYERQKPLAIVYKKQTLDCGYRLDVVVENAVILELKAVDKIEEIHKAQLLTYLKLSGLTVGMILNFNVPVLKDGIVRIVKDFRE